MYTSLSGTFKLETIGIQQFDSQFNIFIEDKLTNTRQDLRRNPTYSFDISKDNNIAGRLFIVFTPKSTPIDEIYPDDEIHVSIDNNYLKLLSVSTIQSVSVCDLQGRILYSIKDINHPEFCCKLNSQGVLIVKVITEKSVSVKKLSNYN